MNLTILPLAEAKQPQFEISQIGDVFTQRMFSQRYTADSGWQDATIGPYSAFFLTPATAVFHYGQAIFEGCKAFRRPDGHVNLFRPWDHVKRFNRSAQRVAMPMVAEEEHLAALAKLIELEHHWLPDTPGSSLYLRPCMVATDAALGVCASKTYLHFIIACPLVASADEMTPLAVYISDEYRRACVGGTGEVKVAGNYAASLYVSEAVKRQGYAQVLWLDAIHGRYIEEVGTMNFAAVYNGKHIVTPALTGSILPGITRDSVLQLAPDLGYTVSEATMDVDDLLACIQSGEITEAFGTGTAAVIAPLGKLAYQGKEYLIDNGRMGPVTKCLRQALTAIQVGGVPDVRGWTLKIEV